MNFIKSNVIFLIWTVFYIIILAVIAVEDIGFFWVLLIMELVSLVVAFSPLGEWLLRVMSGARKIKTEKDEEYLMPIFNAVYEDVKANNKRISRNIQLYIEEDTGINAYAFGSNSISVTRGAIESLSEEQLKGVIAHEFGHMNNGDTKVKLVMTVGNGAFAILWIFLKLISRGHKSDMAYVFILVGIIKFLMAIFVAIGNRHNEYMADKFAFENGHGEGLTESLYMFREMDRGHRRTLKERLKASHPDLNNRIARIETLQREKSDMISCEE